MHQPTFPGGVVFFCAASETRADMTFVLIHFHGDLGVRGVGKQSADPEPQGRQRGDKGETKGGKHEQRQSSGKQSADPEPQGRRWKDEGETKGRQRGDKGKIKARQRRDKGDKHEQRQSSGKQSADPEPQGRQRETSMSSGRAAAKRSADPRPFHREVRTPYSLSAIWGKTP
eukprot:Skav224662  [mRNA]  locus=scaffold3474:140736:141251:- [translate_table: standard]